MKLAAALALAAAAATAAADRLPDPSPKAPIIGRVLKIELTGAEVIATAGVGTDQGVARTDVCAFIDAQDKPVPADCIIIRVDKRTTIVKTKLTMDQIKILRVKFTAP